MAESNLTGDLIIDILSKLPVKSLLRFKCVHRSWYSLLTSSYFITTHLQNPQKKHHHGFIFVPYEPLFDNSDRPNCFNLRLLAPDTFDVNLDYITPFDALEGLQIVGSCNGLVCLCSSKGRPFPKVYLCNPAVKQHMIIPPPTLRSLSNNILQINHSDVFGFGYDSRNNDYKIVMQHCSFRDKWNKEGLLRHTEVFTLGKNSWEYLGLISPGDEISRPSWSANQCYFNGAIHQLATKRKISDYSKSSRPIIISFDVCNEVFQQFLLPDCVASVVAQKTCSIHVYKDLLSIVDFRVSNSLDKRLLCIDIWVMKEYGIEESWIRLHSLRLQYCLWDRMFYMGPGNFSGFGMNGELIFIDYDDKAMILFYPDKEIFKKVEFEKNVELRKALASKESLVSLQHDEGD